MNVIRECGRLDVKNPYEELTGEMGFSFNRIVKDVPEPKGDIEMIGEDQMETGG